MIVEFPPRQCMSSAHGMSSEDQQVALLSQRPRDASCLSVVSFDASIVQYLKLSFFIISYFSFGFTSAQNAAARLITGTRRRDHITPVLRDLHWLPVRRCVDYKLALLVYKSLHGLAPSHLADDCILAFSDRPTWTRASYEDPYPFWRPEFFRCRPPDLEQLAAGTAMARH